MQSESFATTETAALRVLEQGGAGQAGGVKYWHVGSILKPWACVEEGSGTRSEVTDPNTVGQDDAGTHARVR